MLGGITAPTLENLVERYFEARNSGPDPSWYARGFYLTKDLAIETREKNEAGEWVAVSFRHFQIDGLRWVAEHPGVIGTRKPRPNQNAHAVCSSNSIN